MFQNQNLFVASESSGRSLIGSTVEKVGSTAATIVPKWKESLWDVSSTEPAMLRVPIVVLTFIILFALDVIILDRFKLQYHNVMSIKSGIHTYIHTYSYLITNTLSMLLLNFYLYFFFPLMHSHSWICYNNSHYHCVDLCILYDSAL